MSRESDDNLSSINSTYTDMYQETVKRFTRSSLSPDMDRYSMSRRSFKSNSTSLKSDSDRHFDSYVEATGRRRSSDHGAILTADTEQFIIGQKVWVGGIRPGQIAYIGETHFAPGDWAGIVLDEPNGKNDGCVAGKRYFQCEPKRGIFSRLTRLTLAPLAGASTPTSPMQKFSPERSGTVSPTFSMRSSMLRSPGKNGLTVGDRVIVSSGFGSRPGILRYLGETRFASGNWCGVELDEATGKNDGSVDGIKYFDCKPKYGVFVPIAKVSLSPSTKKTRLSRTGSRESLTSIGTLNSIATTNTSRMRMSAQRKPLSIKPASPQKSQFSMQDLLREKQNHIEQLMIERDLDREDSQNQALQYSKSINELKNRIAKLEKDLQEERKKTEDLQFSIDEATFCGDEFSAQSQVYKEKIQDLEKTIVQLTSAPTSLQFTSVQDNELLVSAANEQLNAQIKELTEKLRQQTDQVQTGAKQNVDELKRLQEQVNFLQTENEVLEKELQDKDASMEKYALSASAIDNLQKELALLKEESEKERQQIQSDFLRKLEQKEHDSKVMTEELLSVKSNLAATEGDRTNLEDECEILRSEVKQHEEQLQLQTDQLAKLNTELSMLKAESATLDDMLKTQQQQNVTEKTESCEKQKQLQTLQVQVEALKLENETFKTVLGQKDNELLKLQQLQKDLEANSNAAAAKQQSEEAELKQLLEQLKLDLAQKSAACEKFVGELETRTAENERLQKLQEELTKDAHEKRKECEELLQSLIEVKKTLEDTNSKLLQQEQTHAADSEQKSAENNALTTQITSLEQQMKLLQGESCNSLSAMSGQLQQLNAQIAKQQTQLQQQTAELQQRQTEYDKQQNILKDKNAELSQCSESLDSSKEQIKRLEQELTHLLAKQKELEEQLKSSDNSNMQSQLSIGDLTRKLQALTTKCESLTNENEALQTDLHSQRTNNADLQGNVKQLNEELIGKQQLLTEMQEQRSAECNQLTSQVEQLQQQLANSQKDAELLKEELGKAKAELEKNRAHIVDLEEKSIKQDLAISDALRQQENLQTKYNSLVEQNECLQKDLTTLRTSSTDSNAEMLKLSTELTAKQKAYQELLDKNASERSVLEGQLQASQQRVDALCTQAETLTQELKSSTEEAVKLQEQLKQSQENADKQALNLADLHRKQEALNNKCNTLETQNAELQASVNAMRTTATDTNEEVLKLNTELVSKQKALQELIDSNSNARLQLESQMQQLQQKLEASQNEHKQLQQELKEQQNQNSKQTADYESSKQEWHMKMQKQLTDLEAQQTTEHTALVEKYELQLKQMEQTKITLDEGILNLQNQIKLLQDELLKSQLDFKTKEQDLQQSAEKLQKEKEMLQNQLQQLQSDSNCTLSDAEQQKLELQQTVTQLQETVQEKQNQLLIVQSTAEQLRLQQNNTSSDLTKLSKDLTEMQHQLDVANAEQQQKTKQLEEQKASIEDQNAMIEKLQNLNTSISATNAELSAALELLEQERCETAHIFELFEMESDQNAEELLTKLSKHKQQLTDTQALLQQKEDALLQAQQALEQITSDLTRAEKALSSTQSNVIETNTQLINIKQCNEELTQTLQAHEKRLEHMNDLEYQIAEYKSVMDEIDDAATEKTDRLTHLEKLVQQLENDKSANVEQLKIMNLANVSLERKLEIIEMEKLREITALQSKINDLQSIANLKQLASSEVNGIPVTNEETTAQINFLNSIIADMQKKNDSLKAKVDALEALPTDFTQPNVFDKLIKRKPAPRVFCDICDVFDQHETEDCPIQASDDRDYSPPPQLAAIDDGQKKERKIPEPRKYCSTCEVFGHEAGECNDDETY